MAHQIDETKSKYLSQTRFMSGRRIIKTSVTEITDENVVDVLRKALATHELNRSEIDYLWKYYRGDQPIRNRVKDVRPEICNSYMNLYAKIKMAMGVVRTCARVIASWITQSNQYIEDLNLFTASMGKYAEEAQTYAEAVSEALGIDPGEFMRNQGVFNTIISGFGVASDKAYLMSKNLTQLGYDISSFFNISFEDAMQKLQSGISGELSVLFFMFLQNPNVKRQMHPGK